MEACWSPNGPAGSASIRNGVLDPTPIAGVPRVRTDGNGGLMDVALHPRFAENRLVYFTYTKPVENGKGTPSLARGRLDGGALTDVRDLLVPEAYEGNSGLNGRVVFGRDGMVYMSTGGNIGKIAQDPASLRGKILRLRDDGSVPPDNPFAGRAGYRPEIFTLGHRNTLALIVHPETGALWNNENGPNGGDEINIILPGRNYGWPIVSFGRDYPGPRISEHPTREGMESPLVVVASLRSRSAGMAVYTGDRFPALEGQRLRRQHAHGRNTWHRPPGANRLQRQDRGTAARIDAERTSGSASGKFVRVPTGCLSADGRRRRRAVADRTSFLNYQSMPSSLTSCFAAR